MKKDGMGCKHLNAECNNRSSRVAAIGGLDPGVTRKWLAGRLAGCCLLIDRLHGLN
eukprot:COSAG01_NODE_842_length_13174_cov_44.463250_1_plen_55_part_10